MDFSRPIRFLVISPLRRAGLSAGLFFFVSGFRVSAADGVLAGEVDSALVVHAENHNLDLVANGNDVLDLLDALGVELGNMHESLFAGRVFDEAANWDDARDLAGVDGAGLGVLDDCVDDGQRLVGVVLVDGSDEDAAVVLNIDFGIRVGADFLNHLAARADDLTDLVGVNLGGDHLRRVLRDVVARCGDGRSKDVVDDIESALAGRFQRIFNDGGGQTVDFEVHLDGGDALLRTGNLEVHIA